MWCGVRWGRWVGKCGMGWGGGGLWLGRWGGEGRAGQYRHGRTPAHAPHTLDGRYATLWCCHPLVLPPLAGTEVRARWGWRRGAGGKTHERAGGHSPAM